MSRLTFKTKRVPAVEASLTASLKASQSSILQEVRDAIRTSGMSVRARRAISQYLKIKVDAKAIRMEITNPTLFYLLRGRKEAKMGWLSKAKRPIPIVTDHGDLIFRWPTHKTLQDGRWVHPGAKPSDLLSRIRDRVHPLLREKVRQGLRQTLQRALR